MMNKFKILLHLTAFVEEKLAQLRATVLILFPFRSNQAGIIYAPFQTTKQPTVTNQGRHPRYNCQTAILRVRLASRTRSREGCGCFAGIIAAFRLSIP